jgi:hypothetical protein
MNLPSGQNLNEQLTWGMRGDSWSPLPPPPSGTMPKILPSVDIEQISPWAIPLLNALKIGEAETPMVLEMPSLTPMSREEIISWTTPSPRGEDPKHMDYSCLHKVMSDYLNGGSGLHPKKDSDVSKEWILKYDDEVGRINKNE